MKELTPLSASRIKKAETCSWSYWASYKLKVPDKSNDGASRGWICHLILELLGKEKHFPKYDKVILSESIYSCIPIKKVVHFYAKKLNVFDDDNLALIDTMTMAGLHFDFFGTKRGSTSEIISEKDFDITEQEGDKLYRIKGFIDKLYFYKKDSTILIRDFKTSKSVFKGKEVTDNLQDLIYTLAVKKMFPHFKKRQMEFLFLKFDLNSSGCLKMKDLSDEELEGLEYQLSSIQSFIDNFSENDALSSFAAEKSYPSDGTFGGPLVCGKNGFKISKGQPLLDSNGNKIPAYICPYRNPLTYWIVKDSEGKIIKSVFEDEKDSLFNFEKEGFSIELFEYKGCPYWLQKESADSFFSNYS